MKTNLQWVTGNTKLAKGKYKIVGFGIPADFDFNNTNTCPGALACKAVCYAKQGTYNFPVVKTARRKALKQTQLKTFVDRAVKDLNYFLQKKKYNTVRIHDSGDFYSQEYLDKWKEIARRVPEMKFYAYTKAMHLNLFKDLPSNFNLVQSLGGKYDKLVDLSKSHSRIFTNDSARKQFGYVDGIVNDNAAITGKIKIGLVYHGVKNLTEPQKKYFKLPVVQ